MLEKIKKIIPTRIFKLCQPAYHFLLNFLAALLNGFPSQKLIVIGITGTTGKTSTVYLTAAALRSAGFKVGYTSTAQFSDGDKDWLNDKKMTMVGRFFTQRLIKKMFKNGCHYAIIETTSEGIKQFRHRFINYDSLLFTGLYPEHIEAHGSFENYKKTKGRLFQHLSSGKTKYINDDKIVCRPSSELKKLDLKRVKKTIVVNGDDKQANYFLSFWAEEKIIYLNTNSVNRQAEADKFGLDPSVTNWNVLHYGEIRSDLSGVDFVVEGQPVKLSLLGEFNAKNAIAAYSLAYNQGLDASAIISGLSSVRSLAGKLEKIDEGQNFTVIIDYAFEPRALEQTYKTISLFSPNRIIHVLGSTGGGRDTARRPELGRLAGNRADIVIVSNEDPYDDNPQLIIEQVALGAEEVGKELDKNLFKILDRRGAINKALSLAQEGDLVLISGKGAEQYICVAGSQKIPWDDRRVAREELQVLCG